MTTDTTKTLPFGFGFYLRRMGSKPKQQDIDSLIKRLKASKATWASLMVEAEDGFINPKSNLKPYVDALHSNGIKVWLWTFPGHARASSASNAISAANLIIEYHNEFNDKIDGIQLDVEIAFKGKQQALNAFINEVVNNKAKNNIKHITFVSYPIPSFHKDIDWTCLSKCDSGSPMLYDSAKDKKWIDKSYNEYTKYNKNWYPSLATYETEAAGSEEVQLKGDLDRVFEGNGQRNIQSAIFWAENTTNDAERKVLADYSDLLFIDK